MTDDDFIYYEQYDRLEKEYKIHGRITEDCEIVYNRLNKEGKLIITSCKKFTIELYFKIK